VVSVGRRTAKIVGFKIGVREARSNEFCTLGIACFGIRAHLYTNHVARMC